MSSTIARAQRQPLVERLHAAHRAAVRKAAQDFAHPRARFDAELEQVPAQDDRRRGAMLDAERARALEKPVDRRAVERSRPPEAVRLRDAREQLEVDLLRQPAEGAVADRGCATWRMLRLQVVRDDAR